MICKDTPAFIANRVGVFGIMAVFHVMQEIGLNVDEVDALSGTVMGRPKSATFRTADVVGLDTLVHVAKDLPTNAPNDEAVAMFEIPQFLQKMVENKWLGDKTGQGFYKKLKPKGGKPEILTLNLQTLEYEPKTKTKFATLEAAKQIDDLPQRIKALCSGADKAGEFYRKFHHLLFAYVSNRVPEIADELYKIDDALKAGFGWEIGAFETWDVLGVKRTIDTMKAAGMQVADWVNTMIEKGCTTFFKTENGQKKYYDPTTGGYLPVPGLGGYILLEHLDEKVVWKNSACKVYDIGDEVLALRWNTKMNSIGGEVL